MSACFVVVPCPGSMLLSQAPAALCCLRAPAEPALMPAPCRSSHHTAHTLHRVLISIALAPPPGCWLRTTSSSAGWRGRAWGSRCPPAAWTRKTCDVPQRAAQCWGTTRQWAHSVCLSWRCSLTQCTRGKLCAATPCTAQPRAAAACAQAPHAAGPAHCCSFHCTSACPEHPSAFHSQFHLHSVAQRGLHSYIKYIQ